MLFREDGVQNCSNRRGCVAEYETSTLIFMLRYGNGNAIGNHYLLQFKVARSTVALRAFSDVGRSYSGMGEVNTTDVRKTQAHWHVPEAMQLSGTTKAEP